jgi:hypothetical protein
METGKTYWGIEQTGEKERQKEKGSERERSGFGRKRKVGWVILTIG